MAKALITTNPVSSVAAHAARLSIASAVLFAPLVGSLHLLEPEFNPPWRFISEYELGSFGWMMRLGKSCKVARLTMLKVWDAWLPWE
jgi:hypothetical protein